MNDDIQCTYVHMRISVCMYVRTYIHLREHTCTYTRRPGRSHRKRCSSLSTVSSPNIYIHTNTYAYIHAPWKHTQAFFAVESFFLITKRALGHSRRLVCGLAGVMACICTAVFIHYTGTCLHTPRFNSGGLLFCLFAACLDTCLQLVLDACLQLVLDDVWSSSCCWCRALVMC